jgi:uncharacterized integral membrane protein
MKKHIPTLVLMAVYILLIAGCLATFSSCSTVRKVFHKERSHRDSSVVTSRDSVAVKHEESKENKLSIDSLQIEVQYDTSWLDTLSEPATEYSTPEGKVLGDVIKAARAGGKPKKIIISTGRIEQKTTEQKKDENTHVAEKKETKLSEKTMVIDKTKKKVSWGALTLTILILLIAFILYKKRASIIKWIKTFLPLMVLIFLGSCAGERTMQSIESPARLMKIDTVYAKGDAAWKTLHYKFLGKEGLGMDIDFVPLYDTRKEGTIKLIQRPVTAATKIVME